MNQVILIGRLTKAPEHRTTQSGTSVTTMQLAVSRKFDREKTDFFTVVAWRQQADNCAKYLEKGQQVAVIGELQTRSWEANDGSKRYATEVQAQEIEFLAKAGAARTQSSGAHSFAEAAQMQEAELDDDLPF